MCDSFDMKQLSKSSIRIRYQDVPLAHSLAIRQQVVEDNSYNFLPTVAVIEKK